MNKLSHVYYILLFRKNFVDELWSNIDQLGTTRFYLTLKERGLYEIFYKENARIFYRLPFPRIRCYILHELEKGRKKNIGVSYFSFIHACGIKNSTEKLSRARTIVELPVVLTWIHPNRFKG